MSSENVGRTGSDVIVISEEAFNHGKFSKFYDVTRDFKKKEYI